jgi:hypothetical protein
MLWQLQEGFGKTWELQSGKDRNCNLRGGSVADILASTGYRGDIDRVAHRFRESTRRAMLVHAVSLLSSIDFQFLAVQHFFRGSYKGADKARPSFREECDEHPVFRW